MSHWLAISVVTCTKKSERYLDQAVMSVLSQNCPRLDYWIIDGGSTDGTIRIIQKYEKYLQWVSEPDYGISDAMSKGIRASSSEVVAHQTGNQVAGLGIHPLVDGLVTDGVGWPQPFQPPRDQFRRPPPTQLPPHIVTDPGIAKAGPTNRRLSPRRRSGLGLVRPMVAGVNRWGVAPQFCAISSRGDEVIAPSYTFVSTVSAFVLRGAKIVLAGSKWETPDIDAASLEALVTPRAKASDPMHYAGIGCEMDTILDLAQRGGLLVVEDAAQSIDSFCKGRPVGSLGNFGAFFFHETKNIISDEGEMLAVNDERFFARAEIIREKGTNRAALFRGEVEKYKWIDIGSSFLPSEITAVFLYAQLESLESIQLRRKQIWNRYHELLEQLETDGLLGLPVIPPHATNNAHIFYIACKNIEQRTSLIQFLNARDIMAIFHYRPLHRSPYYRDRHDGRYLLNAERFSDRLLRLPMYYEMSMDDVEHIVHELSAVFKRECRCSGIDEW